MIFLLLIILLCFVPYLFQAVSIFNIRDEAFYKSNNQNYAVYINGQEVDSDTINIKAYESIKIDDDNKYVIITVDGD